MSNTPKPQLKAKDQGPAKGQAKGEPRAKPRARARPRVSQGQAKDQPGPGQGPAMRHGPCLAMTEHPRRAMDVILSRIKALIEIYKSR